MTPLNFNIDQFAGRWRSDVIMLDGFIRYCAGENLPLTVDHWGASVCDSAVKHGASATMSDQNLFLPAVTLYAAPLP